MPAAAEAYTMQQPQYRELQKQMLSGLEPAQNQQKQTEVDEATT